MRKVYTGITNRRCIDHRSDLGHVAHNETVEHVLVFMLELGEVDVFLEACSL